jgi:vesicle-fusing ATPase
MTIQLEDFKAALDEVPPAFGVSENELQQCVQNHVLNFDERVQVSQLDRQSIEDLRHSFMALSWLEHLDGR